MSLRLPYYQQLPGVGFNAGGGGGWSGPAITTPTYITFASGETVVNLSTFDTTGSPSGATNQAIANSASWNPNTGGVSPAGGFGQSGRESTLQAPGANFKWYGQTYRKWADDGESFNPANGIRMMACHHMWNTYYRYLRVWLHNHSDGYAMNGIGIAIYIGGGTSSRLDFIERVGGVETKTTYNNTSTPRFETQSKVWNATDLWNTLGLEIPADFSGDAKMHYRAYGAFGTPQPSWPQIWTFPLLATHTATYDAMTCEDFSRGEQSQWYARTDLNFMWAGTLADSWPTP